MYKEVKVINSKKFHLKFFYYNIEEKKGVFARNILEIVAPLQPAPQQSISMKNLRQNVAHSSATGAASTANNVNEVATDLPDVVGPEMLNE